jgi:Icc protein
LRIVQVSDTHLVPDTGSEIYGANPHASLAGVLEDALALDPPPDHLIATGDLTEDGSAASYAHLRELLLGTRLPVQVIPGNHDNLTEMKRSLVGGMIRMDEMLDVDDWRLVLVDSQCEGKAYGRITSADLERLDRTLAETPRPCLIALHHSPTPPCPYPGCHLRNESEFLDLLSRHANARVVIAGHAHTKIERVVGDAALFTTPSTCAEAVHAPQCHRSEPPEASDFWNSHSFLGERHGYRWLDLQPDGEFESGVRWWDGGGIVKG